MLTLSLLRHAKSSWTDPQIEDFTRPLAQRGIAGAAVMAAYFAESGLHPDLILCSTSARTKATLDLVIDSFGKPRPQVLYEDALYLASATEILERLRTVPGRVRHVMVIGHNPGLQALALDLVGIGGREEITALATKLPTLGLATVTFEARAWADIRTASGRLAAFVAPRTLA